MVITKNEQQKDADLDIQIEPGENQTTTKDANTPKPADGHTGSKDSTPLKENNGVSASKEEPVKKKSVSFYKIQFFQAKCFDYIIMIVGIAASFGVGLAQPLFSWQYGTILNDLGQLQRNPKILDHINLIVLKLYIFAIGMFMSGFLMVSFWLYNGRVTSERIRSCYFRTILKQEQGWFDSTIPYEFSTKVQGQITKIDNALGEKISNLFMNLGSLITCYTMAFSTSWKLSLVIFSLLPIALFAGMWVGKSTQVGMIKSRVTYEKAGGIAEEVLYHIKTVASFTNYEFEKQRFNERIEETYQASSSTSIRVAIGMGIFYFGFYMTYGLALGYGSLVIFNGEVNSNTGLRFNTGDVMIVLFTMMMGSVAVGASTPIIKTVLEACSAAVEFFDLMERKPLMDTSRSVLKPNKDQIIGKISFQNVDFTYPAMKEKVQVFNKLSLNIEPYKKTAIVGHSGCGKSTTLGLILRLYDIQSGQILLDNLDLQTIDVTYLRSIIGYVPQEPVLFNNTIRDNIIFGRENVTEEEIKEACRKAYAEDFINKNQMGLDYIVGTKGSKLSGGQKQRIAIARAILTKPKILILDEATSALDNKSEKEVQKALDIVSQGITTIIVAHRLSTIRNADNIIVLNKGKIAEQGNHEELLKLQGHYYDLVKNEINMDEDFNKDDIEETKREQTVVQTEMNDQTTNRPLLKKEDDQPEKLEALLDKKHKLFSVLMDNKKVVFVGAFFACCAGCSWIVHSTIMGDAIAAMASTDMAYVKEQGFYSAMKYLGFGLSMAIVIFFQNCMFSLQGDYLAKKYRSFIYEKFLKLDMSYFDVPTHAPGVLLTKLSTDSTQINGVALGMFGVTIEVIVSCAIGISVSLAYSWKIGLVNLAIFPILLYLSGLQWRMRSGTLNTGDSDMENKAANILSESICNTKTIFSYNMQEKIVDIYSNLLKHKQRAIIKQGIRNGILFGLFQFFLYADYATLLICGANFMIDPKDPISFPAFMKSMLVSILTAFGLGNAQQHLGDISKGKEALKNLYKVLQEPVTIYQEDPKDKTKANNLKGKIEFRDVCFSYPTMPNAVIFDKFNITIEAGQKVAFVGPSGCGKSSIIQMIERFYDTTSGQVLIDDVNIKDYDLISLRKNISLVMQEPVLFKTTNMENIRYGKLDADDEAVLKVADEVEIGQFLREKNSNTVPSGGEKQRLAIARALLRNPKILLLDEATSALDNEKEKLVQVSLEKLMEGRTTIAVAHRLSTIEKYDVIYVLDKGRIIEYGNHEQLYVKQGIYYKLYNMSKQ
jgi:ATP-binding cassette subfamily B (MDR/TAP) protein 1